MSTMIKTHPISPMHCSCRHPWRWMPLIVGSRYCLFFGVWGIHLYLGRESGWRVSFTGFSWVLTCTAGNLAWFNNKLELRFGGRNKWPLVESRMWNWDSYHSIAIATPFPWAGNADFTNVLLWVLSLCFDLPWSCSILQLLGKWILSIVSLWHAIQKGPTFCSLL